MSGSLCPKCGAEISSGSLLPEDWDVCPSCHAKPRDLPAASNPANTTSDASATLLPVTQGARVRGPASLPPEPGDRLTDNLCSDEDYRLAPPDLPPSPKPAGDAPIHRRPRNEDELEPSFLCFPLLAVVGITLAGMMCLCPLSMLLEFPKGLLMLWGIGLIFGGILWFGFRFKKFTGENMQDEAPWYLRGGLALMLQLSGYVIQEPKVFGPPFCVFLLGGLLCLSPMFIPDLRPYFRRPAAMGLPAPAISASSAKSTIDSPQNESPTVTPNSVSRQPVLNDLLAEGSVAYLTDLEEFESKAGACPIGKNGELGNGSRISIQGKELPKGLGMHPPLPPDVAKASYRLGKCRAVLHGGAALNDTADYPQGAAIFEIKADGKPLWKSPPIKSRGKVAEFQLDVEGVDVLELSVIAQGSNHYVHAVWVKPRLIQKK